MSNLLKIALVAVWMFFVIVMGYMVFFGENSLRNLNLAIEKRDEIALKAQIARSQNYVLSGEIERLRSDLKYIEDIARFDLGMVAKDEIIYKP